MSYLSRPTDLHGLRSRASLAALVGTMTALFFGAPTGLEAQARWTSTADDYDAEHVTAFIDHVRTRLAERHGPLAETLFAMNSDLSGMPHFLSTRTPPGSRPAPSPEPMRLRVEAAHLIHHQGIGEGSLGTLHGSTWHPIGVGWMPHSMFAQSGRTFARWGHARLLAAVGSHAERHN
ncbi:MAG: hypothetical protein OEU54_04050 [Gemmatimonadota bacterium]|nr:hypothetical protein [Gemmatimonadota bacterium]